MDRSNRILATGEHEGIRWVVMHNGMQSRCGYANVPKDHPWYGMKYDDLNCDVHGGLSYGEKNNLDNKGTEEDFWIGFDCAHYNDAPDPSLPRTKDSFSPEQLIRMMQKQGHVRTQEYVEEECKKLCKEIADNDMTVVLTKD